MKRIFIGIGIFVLGLAIGGAVTGTLVKRFYEDKDARLYSFHVAERAMLAGQLRAGLTQLIIESSERQIIDGILFLHQNEQFKGMMGTETSYKAAKEYYVCGKLDFPAEIAQIMNDLPPVPEDRCPIEE